jgi:hypothetical protein
MPGKSLLYAKLTSDPCYLRLLTDTQNTYIIEEVLWRCVDMTGESIFLSKYHDATESKSMLSAIKFVPMTDAEVEKYKSECASTEHRRIYATDDMHNRLALINQDSVDEWRAVARNYEHSDVEWLAIESTALTVSDNLDEDEIDKYNYPSQHDYHVQKAAKKYDRLSKVVNVGLGSTAILTVIFTSIVLWHGRPLLQIFTNDPQLVEIGMVQLYTAISVYVLYLPGVAYGAALRGMGKSMLPTLINIIGICVVRVGWISFIWPLQPTLEMVYYSFPVTWIASGIPMMIAYVIVKRKLFKSEDVYDIYKSFKTFVEKIQKKYTYTVVEPKKKDLINYNSDKDLYEFESDLNG